MLLQETRDFIDVFYTPCVLLLADTYKDRTGIGVRIVQKLKQAFAFSPNVRLLDTGMHWLKLLEPVTEADYLMVVDVMKNGQPPETIERRSPAAMRKRILLKNSLH